MRSLEIIAEKVSPEGRPIPQIILARMATDRVRRGEDIMLKFGDVVFTVAIDPTEPYIHIYSRGVGFEIFGASIRFMRAVWRRVDHQFLWAPIENLTVMKLARRFGWSPIRKMATGHTLYQIERPK